MANNTKNQNTTQSRNSGSNAKDRAKEHMVDVLYQKMGDRWFAFSLIDDEVFVGSISQDEIDGVDAKTGTYKITGTS